MRCPAGSSSVLVLPERLCRNPLSSWLMNLLPAWTLCLRIRSCNILNRLNKEDKVTVICSLHYLDLIQRYATRVIGLKDGVKVFEGLPTEINRVKFKEIYGEEAQDVRATALE